MGDIMKRIIVVIAFIALALTSGIALGADAKPYDWTGFYIGAQGGYGIGHNGWTYASNNNNADHNIHGGLVGLYMGVNRQFSSNIVLGVETEASATRIKGHSACPNDAWTCSTDVDWLGSTRVRAGYAIDRFLPYVAAGAAYGDVQIRTKTNSTGQKYGGANGFDGWTAGTGLEYAITKNIIVRGEYDYYKFRKTDAIVDFGLLVENRIHISTFKLGIGYKF
jgi:outer membrane immunogenic protein